MLTNEHLKKMFYHYALHEEGEQVDIDEKYVDDALNVIDILTRIVKSDETYYNPEFGVNGNKLYIDGCTEYLTEDEKKLVKEFFGESEWSEKEKETGSNEI